MPRVALTTLGCKVNQFETEVMEGLFKERAYDIVGFDEEADFYIVNTCSVTHLGERKSRQLVRRAARLNPCAVVAVTGCYAQVAPEDVASLEGVGVVIGTKERHRIVDLVEQAARERSLVRQVTDIMAADEFEDIPLFDVPARTRAFLKIQEGCTNFCTYCIIPYARGPLRSRKPESVRREAEKLVAAGFKEIVLTGIHLGAYGRDLPEAVQLADAVRQVLSVKGLARLRLGSLESIELSPDLLAIFAADERFCPHLHLPLQAGQDDILKAMNRHYTTEEFRHLLEDVQKTVPGVAVSTDIIVGFPGETDEMFRAGLAFVKSLPLMRAHVFPYSKRSGTPAALYEGQVPEAVKKARAHAMQAAADVLADKFRKSFIGETVSVLFETKDESAADGLTPQYLRVYADPARAVCGEVCDVTVEKLYKDGVWGSICK